MKFILPKEMHDVLHDILTGDDRAAMLEGLDALSRLSFQTHIDIKKSIFEIFTYTQATQFCAYFASKNIDFANPHSVAAEIEVIRKALAACETVILHIAFKPKLSILARIVEAIETALGQKVLLDIHVNPSLIAGAVIEYKGLYRDYSFIKKYKEKQLATSD